MRIVMLFFFIMVTFCVAASLTGQVQEAWIETYESFGEHFDTPTAMAIDSDDNIILTGGSNENFATVKYDRNGNELWVATYLGYGYDGAVDVVVDYLDNIYVTGTSRAPDGNPQDYVTIKYNPEGEEQWVRIYDNQSGERDYASAIDVDDEGNCYVTGYGLFADYQIGTVKYDTNGNQQWVATYDHPNGDDDVAYDLVVDDMGQAYVTGYSEGNGTGKDYITLKYNSSGQQLWAARYDRSGSSFGDLAYAIALDDLGNVYVTGTSDDDTTNYDYCTIKYGSGGSRLWTARYEGFMGSDDVAHDIIADGSGNVYVTGESYGDMVTIKYDSEGNMLWVSNFDGQNGGLDIGSAIALDIEGNVYVTGSSSPGFLSFDFATVKYSSEGKEIWSMFYDPGPNAEACGISVDSRGDIVVVGEEVTGENDTGYTTIKYRQNPLIHRERVKLR